MQKFNQVTGVVAPMDRPNVDTDAIIPKQYLKSIKRSGFGPNAFDDWRYLDPGAPDIDNTTRRENPDFILNQAPYDQSKVLIARENFGCGSSREHAVWALDDFGFRAVIAPSFADIFFNNSFKNGMLPIVLSADIVDTLFNKVANKKGFELTINLEQQKVITEDGEEFAFEVEAFRKHCLLNGLDDISLTLQYADEIKAYEEKTKQTAPWLF
ncbi:3-isopropylmalate dehydratase small subunit [hydrothermal vent metagenome]|uniref:3-isopropylmalate dehydratase n=1 Tax=hydrothermal vent metagenome TaxID=652676 RepID=A0A3B0X325_9ZZZZ